ncbi:MAG TPA: AmmeMemoRadiSam system radical SAM enzyme [Phycisphaerae bacterium]|nr:AmmeMemoRadiSam system radical SAM enzyme [Phycisphaerae bacterium]
MSATVKLTELLHQHTAPAAAELVRPEPEGALRCLACAHRCRVLPGRPGVCRVRWNEGGTLRVPYGYVAGLGVDPIEKKPFYHAYPGATAMSFGMLGCDFHCSFCQNWVTSQALRDDEAISSPVLIEPQRIVELALEHGCRVLTSTYNEPLITAEWAVEIFKLGRPHGLVGSFVSNGNATPEVLEYLRPHVELYKIDLKAFRDETYRKLGGVLENVLNTIRLARQMGFWVELVTLLVPGMNDSDEELKQMTAFIAGVSPQIPWHVTAFHPDYKMTQPPRTTSEMLERAYDIGRQAGLQFIYAGNLPGQVGDRENTKCPACGQVLIERQGFSIRLNRLRAGRCPACGTEIPGVWE